jgi:hypothetical protein
MAIRLQTVEDTLCSEGDVLEFFKYI